MTLSQAIETTSDAISHALDAISVKEPSIVLNHPVDPSSLSQVANVCRSQLADAVQSSLSPPNIDVDDVEDQETKAKVSSFKDLFLDKSQDLVLAISFQTLADRLNQEYMVSSNSSLSSSSPSLLRSIPIEKDVVKNVSEQDLSYFSRLFILLDAFAYLVISDYPGIKPSFYICISNILDVLFNVSPKAIDIFWYYMETRFEVFQDKVFDASAVSDRISLLELTNRVTDKFYIYKKKDSYQKDSFNDRLDARVRLFVTKILLFEDNTGLNKYFSVSNRVINESIPTGKFKTNNSFLIGTIQLQKLLKDPYYFLKQSNHRVLREYVDIMRDVVDHLLQEEVKSKKLKATTIPTTHEHYSLVAPKKSDLEESNLKTKYSGLNYFPELFWLSPFEKLRGAEYDELKSRDLEFWDVQFKNPKFRRTYLLQIYIITGMLVELSASNKKELLKTISAPASIKHITEDSLVETYLPTIIRIRKRFRDVMKQCDEKFFFLLQHLAVNELYWWGWLIYNKTVDGKPFFNEAPLTSNDIGLVKDKFKTVIPFKEKRYFNLYGTPQLSRKMKTPTGLDLLKKDNLPDIDLLKGKLATLEKSAEDGNVKEQISILRWKIMKVERTYEWLNFGTTIDKQKFMDKEEEEEEPARKKVKVEETEQMEEDEPNEATEQPEISAQPEVAEQTEVIEKRAVTEQTDDTVQPEQPEQPELDQTVTET